MNFQRAGARDDKGNPIIRDFYSSPLTARYVSLKPDIVQFLVGLILYNSFEA